jgi:hypothetical protein
MKISGRKREERRVEWSEERGERTKAIIPRNPM